MNGAFNGVISVLTAIVGVAALAVIFGTNSKTAQVIGAGGTALAEFTTAAVAPVTSGAVVALRPLLGHA